jgi:hypothetical protein
MSNTIVPFLISSSARGDEALLTDGSTGALSDTFNLKRPAVGLLLSVAGNIKILTDEGAEQTYAGGELALGIWHPIRVKRVFSTGTALLATEFRLGFARY